MGKGSEENDEKIKYSRDEEINLMSYWRREREREVWWKGKGWW